MSWSIWLIRMNIDHRSDSIRSYWSDMIYHIRWLIKLTDLIRVILLTRSFGIDLIWLIWWILFKLADSIRSHRHQKSASFTRESHTNINQIVSALIYRHTHFCRFLFIYRFFDTHSDSIRQMIRWFAAVFFSHAKSMIRSRPLQYTINTYSDNESVFGIIVTSNFKTPDMKILLFINLLQKVFDDNWVVEHCRFVERSHSNDVCGLE